MKKNQRHYLAFLKTIKAIRLRGKTSQKELAERLGARQSFVSKYESGERRLDLIETRQICSALGSTLKNLLDELEEEIRNQR